MLPLQCLVLQQQHDSSLQLSHAADQPLSPPAPQSQDAAVGVRPFQCSSSTAPTCAASAAMAADPDPSLAAACDSRYSSGFPVQTPNAYWPLQKFKFSDELAGWLCTLRRFSRIQTFV